MVQQIVPQEQWPFEIPHTAHIRSAATAELFGGMVQQLASDFNQRLAVLDGELRSLVLNSMARLCLQGQILRPPDSSPVALRDVAQACADARSRCVRA
jgi:hypothetical protein